MQFKFLFQVPESLGKSFFQTVVCALIVFKFQVVLGLHLGRVCSLVFARVCHSLTVTCWRQLRWLPSLPVQVDSVVPLVVSLGGQNLVSVHDQYKQEATLNTALV